MHSQAESGGNSVHANLSPAGDNEKQKTSKINDTLLMVFVHWPG